MLAFVLGTLHVPPIGPLPAINLGLGVASAGSPLLAFLVTLLLALGAVNLGIFLSTFARTEFQILQFIPMVIVPQALLCGIIWPVESLPDVLQADGPADADDLRHRRAARGTDQGRRPVGCRAPARRARTGGVAVLLAVVARLTIRREVA